MRVHRREEAAILGAGRQAPNLASRVGIDALALHLAGVRVELQQLHVVARHAVGVRALTNCHRN